MHYNIIVVDGSYIARSRFETGTLPDGFFAYCDRLKDKFDHDSFWIAWDHPSGSAKRKEIYPGYKGNRKKNEQYLLALRALKMMIFNRGMVQVESKNGEADDVIYTVSAQNKGNTLIATNDKDLLQLVSERCNVIRSRRGEDILVTINNFRSYFELKPESWADYLALVGDSADQIKGAPGIGEKTAKRLLKACETIDGITEEKILAADPSMLKHVRAIQTSQGSEQISLARELIRLRKCKLDFTFKDDDDF